jgi:PKD repeat protein
MRRDAMSKLSASLFALVVVLSTLVIPFGNAEAETLGTNTIFVPVTSNGSPVSTGVTVTLTNVHTGEVLPATYSQTMKLYTVDSAPSGYYRVDVVANDYYDSIGERQFKFTGLASYTVSPQIALDSFPSKQWEWNVTVRDSTTNMKIVGAQVGFYDLSVREMVSKDTTDSLGVAIVDMFNSADPDYALVVEADLYETYVEPTAVTADNVMTVYLTRSVRVTGFVTDSDGPASNVVAYMLSMDSSNAWVKRLLKSEEGTFFTFDAYPGEFILCVDADGASAEVQSVDLTGNSPGDIVDLSMSLANQTQMLDSVEMVFGADYNSFALTETTEWNYDDAFPGLNYNDVGSLRMQVDLNSPVPDGALDAGEVSSFVSQVQGYGAKHVTSSRLLLVNDTLYTAGTLSGFTLTLAPGSVTDTTSVPYSYSCTYTSVDALDIGADDYTATLYAAYDTPSANRTFSVALPTGYELVDNSSGATGSHVVVTGYEVFAVDPEEYIGGPEAVSLAFEKYEIPSAGAGMEVAQGLVYAVTDDEGNVTKYIVRVGSEVNFSAMDSLDPNGNPMLYTWDFDDGSPAETTSNVTITHNYTTASAGRTVNLTVTDAVGLVNWTEIEVVCDNRDPVPVITVKDREINETTDSYEIDQGEAIWFNATASSDDAVTAGDGLGEIDFFEFYYGDGNESGRMQWEDEEKNASHSFAEAGTYDVVLNVTDVVGHWKNTTITVKVNDSDAPSVSFVVKNATYGTTLIENATIVLDANATVDNLDDKEDMYFSWDFGDDLGDDSWLNGTGLWNVTYVYQNVGTFTVTLNVTDSSNNTGMIKRSVRIESSARPNVVIDGAIYFEPAEFTEGEQGFMIVNLTNKGSAIATNVVLTFYIVGEDSDELIDTWSQLLNGTQVVTTIEVGGKVQVKFPWTPDARGTYKIKVNVTSQDQLVVDSRITKSDEALVVKEAPWKQWALWGGIAAVIILIPVLLYLRGRWSKRERKGPRRDRDKERAKTQRREMKERAKLEKREKREKEKLDKHSKPDKPKE